jgi:small subunit ribosomal protein S15
MNLTAETKKGIFKKHGKSEKNTGSPEGQIAMYTEKIAHLTGHLGKNKKDMNTQRSLINMVGRRKRLLDYLKKNQLERYRSIIKSLDLRK